MAITVQQCACLAYQNTDLQEHDYAKSQQELREAGQQSQVEIDKYLSLKKIFGKRVALLEAIKTLEAYEETISDLNCFDDQQRTTRKDVMYIMDDMLELIGDTLVLNASVK